MKLYLGVFLLALIVLEVQSSCMSSLYAGDPLYHTLDFLDGSAGITYDHYLPNYKASNIALDKSGLLNMKHSNDQTSIWLDLGTSEDLIKRYRINWDVPQQSVYYGIHFKEDYLVLPKGLADKTWQPFPLRDIEPIHNNMTDSRSFLPKANHIYLLAIHDKGHVNTNFALLVKMLVLEYIEGSRITVRWDTLRADQTTGASTMACWVSDSSSGPAPGPGPSDRTFYNAPKWVRACIIILFVAVGVLLVAVVGMGIKMSRRHDYREI